MTPRFRRWVVLLALAAMLLAGAVGQVVPALTR
jgi:hypothetical protein